MIDTHVSKCTCNESRSLTNAECAAVTIITIVVLAFWYGLAILIIQG